MSIIEDYKHMTITTGSSSNPQLGICEFCSENILTQLRFVNSPICPKCNNKLKERVKLILEFQ